MPKLLRISFSNIGNRNARFHGHLLDFRADNTQDPVSCLIHQPNGLGKSTQIKLFSSIFVPDLRKFIGGNTRENGLENYLKKNQLGIIATEWTIDDNLYKCDSLFPDKRTATRIIGQALLRPNSSEDKIKRFFFSFNTNDMLYLEKLPMGFDGDPIMKFDDFRTWLRKNTTGESMVESDAFIGEVHSEWREFLRKRKIHPEQFQLMARMNLNESTAHEIIRNVRDEGDFVDLILSPLISPDEYSELLNLVEKYQLEIKKIPEARKEKEFIEAISAGFFQYSSPAKEFNDVDVVRNKTIEERKILAEKIVATSFVVKKNHSTLLQNQKDIIVDLESVNEDIEVAQNAIKQAKLKKQNLELEGVVQEISSNSKKIADAEDERIVAAASLVFAELRKQESEIRNLDKIISKENEPSLKILNELKKMGSMLYELYDSQNIKLEKELERLVDEENTTIVHVGSAEKELSDLTAQSIIETTNLEHLEGWFKEYHEEKEVLYSEKILIKDQPEIGMKALEDEANRLKSKISQSRTEIDGLQLAKNGLIDRESKAECEIGRLEEIITNLKQQRDVFLGERDKLASCPVLIGIEDVHFNLGNDSIDPFSPGLINRLKTQLKSIQDELLRIENRIAEQQLLIEEVSENGYFPPDRELQKAIKALLQLKVTSFPYGVYLRESKGLSCNEVRSVMRKNPLLFSILCVPGQEHLKVIKENLPNLPDIKRPIIIKVVAIDDARGKDQFLNPDAILDYNHVILPRGNATIDKDAAFEEKKSYEDQVAKDSDLLGKMNLKILELEECYTTLSLFLEKYDDDTYGVLENNIRKNVEYLADQKQILRDAKAKQEENIALMQKCALELKDYEAKLRDKEAEVLKLSEFQVRFESKMSDKLDRKKFIQSLLLDNAKEKETLLEKVEFLNKKKGENCAAISRIQQKREKIIALQNEIEYRLEKSAKTQKLTWENANLNELQSLYFAQKELFESQSSSQKSNELRITRDLLSNKLKDAKKEYQKKMQGSSEEAVKEYLDNRCQGDAANIDLDGVNKKIENLCSQKGKLKSQLVELKKKRDDMKGSISTTITVNLDDYNAIDVLGQYIQENEASLSSLDKKLAAKIKERASLSEALQKSSQDQNLLRPLIEQVTREFVGESSDEEFDDDADESKEYFFRDANVANDEYQRLENAFRKVESEYQAAKAKMDKATKRIRAILDDPIYKNVCDRIKQGVSQSAEEWYLMYETIQFDLNEIKEALIARLNGMESKKKDILELLRLYVESDIRKILELNSSSKIPESEGTWNQWQGKSFIKVAITSKKDLMGQSLLTVLGSYLESLVSHEKNLPKNSAQLVVGAVKAILRNNCDIKILCPRVDAMMTYERVSLLHTFSGGEGYLAAIVIYFSIVNLISKFRYDHICSNMIMLDNPLGSCNKPEFIELQHILAKKLDIQIIIYTGIEDLKSYGEFPKLISFRSYVYNINGSPERFVVDSSNSERRIESSNLFIDEDGWSEAVWEDADETTIETEVNPPM